MEDLDRLSIIHVSGTKGKVFTFLIAAIHAF